MIVLDTICKRYGTTMAVDNLTLEVANGEVCVLIGPSGCGKTTTLRMINRLAEPTSGKILIDGQDIGTLKTEILRRSIGYAIQSVGLFPHMTVADNIAVVPKLLEWPASRVAERVSELLNMVGLNDREYANKYPVHLSGGEAQRVGVARALAADPPILLMDEPFGAVDPLTRERLQTRFIMIQRELRKSVILVTHDLDEAIRLADRIAIMSSGKLMQYDTPEHILSHPDNKFVNNFIGADRALKRLSRIPIDTFITGANSVEVSTSPETLHSTDIQRRWLWVVDNEGRLVGWLDRRDMERSASLQDSMVYVEPEECAIIRGTTLREALSRMLGQGIRELPVIDENSRLIGEISLSDIEHATADIEK